MERPQAAPKHDPAERSCFGEEERPMSDQELERIEGAVSAVIFQNEENGYAILKLDVRGEEW